MPLLGLPSSHHIQCQNNDRSGSGTTCSVQPGMSLPHDLVMQCNPDATHDSIIQLHNKSISLLSYTPYSILHISENIGTTHLIDCSQFIVETQLILLYLFTCCFRPNTSRLQCLISINLSYTIKFGYRNRRVYNIITRMIAKLSVM